ncbi:MAG: TIGR04283 family arsenosugar biosynthesis glycosyltransferase [Syntrophobacteraceae bacterium]
MKNSGKALIVFMRYPESGQVKSRLAVSIGAENAALIYEKLVRRTLGVTSDLKRIMPEVDIFLFFTPENKRTEVERKFAGPWELIPQKGAHLGERMDLAVRGVLARRYGHCVLIGADIADITVADMLEAFRALEQGYTPLGPAKDGGFFLIGLNRHCPSVFENTQWGTSGIYRRTANLLLESGFKVIPLAPRHDIDREEDLEFLRDKPLFSDKLSIVVPTMSSADQLSPFLLNLEDQLWPGDEIIVVRGGSATEERPIPLRDRIQWIASPKGRGIQLNRGASATKGNLLLFLHDDCNPPPLFLYHVRKISEAGGVALGCFKLSFDPSTPLLKLIARWANYRSRRFKLPFGDQGLFCRKEIFYKAGGFKKRFIMEDVDFVRHCLKEGELLIVQEHLCTSPQRYMQKGILRASLQNHLMMLLYRMGIEDETLYSIYYG